jgi:hypothetical protein
VTDEAKLCDRPGSHAQGRKHPAAARLVALVGLAGVGLTACSGAPSDGRVRPTYDREGKLTELAYDSDNDGRVDVRVSMDGNRPLRSEVDADEDGRVERWEHFDQEGRVERVGSSSQQDGVEDTWTFAGPDGQPTRIERVTPKGLVWRREIFEAGDLARVEEDGDRDGLLDRWEGYSRGVVVSLALDTTKTRGQPDRRLIYGPGGTLERIEADPEGDGTFAALPSPAASASAR